MMEEPIPQWAQQLQLQFTELERLLFDIPLLRDKTTTNHNEIEKNQETILAIKKHTVLVPRILEIAIATQTHCDKLSEKVKALENAKSN